ncbi:TetR family transcriptional regulator [Catellatospora sp. TT07R-123]|uniref:TetR/AcrR family transcriptional regulator C-terminal domain-containing protein n=1 Tax=Catellatospora sp. TT07R-123 TaxID=2733863 RepID=UPI001B0DE99A|nr:TetR/AcrR family transcriptional regulator C-terminal domain-containing protein [Catellatospora sp. TT07R-123]GHJ47372.1 TetR family transcriptional regulator [Catellatospora sp. TT07R-123]
MRTVVGELGVGTMSLYRYVADRIRDAVTCHGAMIPLLLAHRHSSPGVMRCGEALLDILARTGLGPADRLIAYRALLAYLAGALAAQDLHPPHTDEAVGPNIPDGYPRLAQASAAGHAISPDDEFRGGLHLFLNGLRQPPSPVTGAGHVA